MQGLVQLQRAVDQSPRVQAGQSNHSGLPDRLKAGLETLSGLAMDDVRVHYESSKPAQLGALAYAQGRDIHLAPGQQRHLPHEAWHVVQQAQGRVRPTLQLTGGVAASDDQGMEREADVMGTEAASGGAAAARNSRKLQALTIPAAVIQGVWATVKGQKTRLNLRSWTVRHPPPATSSMGTAAMIRPMSGTPKTWRATSR